MGNNLTPYSIAIGWENIYYLTPFFKFIKKENIDVNDIDKLFDIDYDDIMNREEIEINKIYSTYDSYNCTNTIFYSKNRDSKRYIKFL